jgi:hypothetical protein
VNKVKEKRKAITDMKKSPILYQRISKLKAHRGKLAVGIIGTHKGAGVTHLGILLAAYLSEWAGYRTAYLECYPKKDMQYLKSYLYDDGNTKDLPECNTFKIKHVTFYCNVKEQEMAEIIGEKYDCVILDLGTDFLKSKNEFLRCDRRFVVGSLAMWKRYELDKFIQNTEHIKYSDEWIYMIPFSQKRDVIRAEKEFQRNIYGVPFEPDPFLLSSESVQLFQTLL